VPDATHGVVQGHLVQQVMCVTAPCPPQPIAGRVQILSAAGAVVTRDVDGTGAFGALLEPGSYTVQARAPDANTCPPMTVTIVAGQTTDVTIECTIR
jgi:hypothetical protein